MTALAQSAARPEAVPSRRLAGRADLHHELTEIRLDIEESAGKPGDMVAMRICSKEPLAVSMFTSVVSPLGVGEGFVRGFNIRVSFAPEHVLILRSPQCPVTQAPYVPIEFWGVPKGAALPAAVESLKLCQVTYEAVGSREAVKSPRAYRAALKALAVKLSANAESFGVILGEYNLRPSASLKRALKETGRFLERSGVPRRRFFVRLKPAAYYDPEFSGAEPKFPDILAVRIAQACLD